MSWPCSQTLPHCPKLWRAAVPPASASRSPPVGRVLAADGLIHVEHRCEGCQTGFFFVGKMND